MERINLTDTIRTIAGELDKVTDFDRLEIKGARSAPCTD